jgi:A/G-specific adenine glycosylase
MHTIADTEISTLMKWFDVHQRIMPWRGDSNSYNIWISEVMLQQTQVKTVIPYYNRWIRMYPSIEILADSDTETVLRLWEGLGYYTRALNLLKGARYVIEHYGGKFPTVLTDALKIPGVGHYIAGAVLSIAYNLPVAAVDGNVIRVFSRLFALDELRNINKTIQAIVADCYTYYQPRWVNQAWMEFGALQCVPKPVCSVCPMNASCKALLTDKVLNYPVKKQKKKTPVRTGRIYIVQQNETVLMLKRHQSGLLAGMWELPNILEDDEIYSDFEQNHSLKVMECIGTVNHAYSHFKVVYQVYLAELLQTWNSSRWIESTWASSEQLELLAKPKVHIKALKIKGDIL